MRIAIALLAVLLCFSPLCAGSPVSFSGGSTSIRKVGGDLEVRMSGGASVRTDTLDLSAEEIEIWGEEYRWVRCSGAVKAVKEDDLVTLLAPSLLFDRKEGTVLIDSWVEIEDAGNEAALSAAHLDYNLETGLMRLQIQARMVKRTDEGLLSCSADLVTYDAKAQTLVLAGRASVVWGDDSYKAAKVTIDLATNELRLEGRISGAVNG